MRRILLLAAAFILIIFAFRFCEFKSDDSSLEESSGLIQQQILNVGKLIVTEGYFAEVLTYKDRETYMMELLSFEKKALLVVNAKVTVAYDLRKITYDINEKEKTITILSIPKEEVSINPDIKFYDVDQSSMNPFTGDDYNKINAQVKTILGKKIAKSALKSNAKNRLVSELSKILILTHSMGWTLKYEDKAIVNEQDLSIQIKG